MNHRYPQPQRNQGPEAGPAAAAGRRPDPRRARASAGTRPGRLPVPPPSHRTPSSAATASSRSATALLDRPTSRVPIIALDPWLDEQRGPVDTGPRQIATVARPTGMEPARSRRLAQIALVAVLAAVAGGLAIALPNDDSAEQADGGSTTRVETDGPTASASLLASDDGLGVDGELTDSGGLASGAGGQLRLPGSSGPVANDTGASTSLIEPPAGPGPDSDPGAAPAKSPSKASTTTAAPLVEPPISPESDWVDSGNGVLVPDLQLRIRFCESTNDYQAASRYSTARGAYQFLTGSWEFYGHAARTGVAQAHLATPAQQDQAALATLLAEGTGPWAESRPCWADPDIDPRYATANRSTSTTTATTTTTDATGSTATTDDTSTTSTTDDSTTTETTASTTVTTASTTTTAPASTGTS